MCIDEKCQHFHSFNMPLARVYLEESYYELPERLIQIQIATSEIRRHVKSFSAKKMLHIYQK